MKRYLYVTTAYKKVSAHQVDTTFMSAFVGLSSVIKRSIQRLFTLFKRSKNIINQVSALFFFSKTLSSLPSHSHKFLRISTNGAVAQKKKGIKNERKNAPRWLEQKLQENALGLVAAPKHVRGAHCDVDQNRVVWLNIFYEYGAPLLRAFNPRRSSASYDGQRSHTAARACASIMTAHTLSLSFHKLV